MNTLEHQIRQFIKLGELVEKSPPSDQMKYIKKKIEDIRDLLIHVDTALDIGRSPAPFFIRIDDILNDVDNLIKANNIKV